MNDAKRLIKLYFKKKEPLLVYGRPWFFVNLMAQYYDDPTKGLMSVHICNPYSNHTNLIFKTHCSSTNHFYDPEIISFELPQILAERIGRAHK